MQGLRAFVASQQAKYEREAAIVAAAAAFSEVSEEEDEHAGILADAERANADDHARETDAHLRDSDAEQEGAGAGGERASSGRGGYTQHQLKKLLMEAARCQDCANMPQEMYDVFRKLVR